MTKKFKYENVYEGIRKRIKDGDWKPGTKIPKIEDLSIEFNVGTSSVREAIRILGQQKVLTIEQGRGTFVKNDLPESPGSKLDFLEKATFLQLAEARLIIEPELAALAAEKGTSDEKKAIVNVAKAMKKKHDEKKDFLNEDLRFHYLIAEISKNQILTEMIYLMNDLLVDSRRESMKWKGMDEKATAYHLLIADAIATHNPTQASNLMKSHLQDLINGLEEK